MFRGAVAAAVGGIPPGAAAGKARTIGQLMAQNASEAARAQHAKAVAEPDEAQEPTPTEEPTQEKDPTETRYERSRRAFLRAGWKEDEFRKLDRQEAIRRGIKLERQQNRQATEVAKAKSDAEKKGESSQARSNGETQSRVAAPSDESLLAELFTQLDIAGDPEAQAALRAKLSPVLSERAQLKRDIEQRSQGSDANQRARIERAREQVAKSIPELADNDDFETYVAPVIVALATTPRYAAASTDDAVLVDLIETASRLALEEVGESAGPSPERGAPGRGFLDMKGPTVTRGADPVDPKQAFMQSVYAEIDKLHRAAG